MVNIRNDFEKIAVSTFDCSRGRRYFDPIRNTFVPITPEETVRQRMIIYMQEVMSVPKENVGVEEHMSHYGIKSSKGRMDIVIRLFDEDNKPDVLCVIECKEEKIYIEGMQVREQAEKYSRLVNADYFGLVNGINIQFFHKNELGEYVPIDGIPSFRDIKADVFFEAPKPKPFVRLKFEDYFDEAYLRKQPWFYSKIGEDTDASIIPAVIALDDCLLDGGNKCKRISSSRFTITEDLGVHFRQYNDMSDGGFGSGNYRVFLIKDNRTDQQFLCGFTIITTAKLNNDPKYGNQTGKSVLVCMFNNGDVDETVLQINLNSFLKKNDDNSFTLSHNGAVVRKGAKKKRFAGVFEDTKRSSGGR